MSQPTALTIAGSDSGGGAGIQGDLKTFEAFGVYGTCVITAVTAQNTTEITSIEELSAQLVRAQLAAVLADIPPSAVKIGMLPSVPAIRAVASLLAGVPAPIVIDPVLVGKTGRKLSRTTSLSALVRELFPLAALVTPNLPEASALAGFPIRSEADAKSAARKIQALGPRAVLIKGGHGEGPELVDGLLDGRTWHRFSNPRIDSTSTHGTGCALASAIAALLALGVDVPDAVPRAIQYVRRAIEHAPELGAGAGPIGHRQGLSSPGPQESAVVNR
jgi:hydroxymethylpyrimidine kinase/phosphomethylpyrimidine kinase